MVVLSWMWWLSLFADDRKLSIQNLIVLFFAYRREHTVERFTAAAPLLGIMVSAIVPSGSADFLVLYSTGKNGFGPIPSGSAISSSQILSNGNGEQPRLSS